ncbi:MAG: hypothetical protein IPM38_06820 [Ignavibacteria bacterium]|nr:hypothetical protein [Ignavibacteria bacterium]
MDWSETTDGDITAAVCSLVNGATPPTAIIRKQNVLGGWSNTTNSECKNLFQKWNFNCKKTFI